MYYTALLTVKCCQGISSDMPTSGPPQNVRREDRKTMAVARREGHVLFLFFLFQLQKGEVIATSERFNSQSRLTYTSIL